MTDQPTKGAMPWMTYKNGETEIWVRGASSIVFDGPDREANARKFILVDELENLVKQISFYKVEGDDALIRISVCGIEVASVSNDDPRCIGVIKFDAEQRTILAKIKGDGK